MLNRIRTKAIDTNPSGISSEDYARFKNSVASGNVFKQPIKFSEIGIEDNSNLKVHGKALPMTESAFLQLCRILGLDKGANQSLMSTIGIVPTAQIMDLVRQAKMAQKKNEVGMTINKTENGGIITGFSKSTKTILPGKMFIESLEVIMNNNPELQIIGASHENNGNIMVVAKNPTWAFDLAGINDESFHAGLSYSLNDGSGLTIDQYMERLICSNGLSYRGNSERMKCSKEDNLGPFLRAAANLRGFSTDGFKQRAESFLHLPASVREVKNSVKELKKVFGKDGMDLVNSHIPYQELKEDARRKLGVFNVYGMPDEFLAKMNSNMNYWDLVNALTYVASHEIGEMSEQHNLMTHAGDMMIANPDLFMPISQIYPKAQA
jgi:hypothetical protein